MKIVFGTDETEVPDEVGVAMKEKVGRFPQYHGNLAEWVADWVKGTLVSLAQQDHAAAHQADFEKSQRQIAAMFDKP